MIRPPGALALALGIALAACQPRPGAAPVASPEPGASPPSSATPSAAASTPVATLAGEWRVAGVDGAPLAGAVGIALSADDAWIWWNPRCAGVAYGYAIEGYTLRLRFDEPGPAGASAKPVCLIAIPLELARVQTALRAATRIERLPSNGVLLSGGGHDLLLFSQ